jgi:hypothetical protein
VKAQLTAFFICIAAVIVLVLVARLVPFGKNQKVMELEAKLEVAEQMAIEKGAQVIKLQKLASSKDAAIQDLKEQLITNKTTTNEKSNRVYALHADSLAGHVANQIDYLNFAWY